MMTSIMAHVLQTNSSRYRLWLENKRFADSIPEGALVLDAGAGEAPYKALVSHAIYESADFEKVDKVYAKSTYVCDLSDIPVGDGRYDFIFFDSPPILGVSDASVLASEMDMVVQVIQYRRYPQPMNLRAKQVIEKVGGTFLGIVLNNINMSQDESYYYYSGYYHDYYYSGNAKDQEAAAPKDADDTEHIGIKQKY